MVVLLYFLLFACTACALSLRKHDQERHILQQHTRPNQHLRHRYLDTQPDTVGLLLSTAEEDIHVWLPLGKRIETGMLHQLLTLIIVY